eukprot:763730-Hanusia_phi.AAC.5
MGNGTYLTREAPDLARVLQQLAIPFRWLQDNMRKVFHSLGFCRHRGQQFTIPRSIAVARKLFEAE